MGLIWPLEPDRTMLPISGTLPPPKPRPPLPFALLAEPPLPPPPPISTETPEGAERGAPKLDGAGLDELASSDPVWTALDARKIWLRGGFQRE